jgi:hypothetical protein
MNKMITTVIVFFMFSFGFSQTNEQPKNTKQGIIKIEGLSLQIKINSADELENETFQNSDIKSIFKSDKSEIGTPISLEIICNKEITDNKVDSSMSFKINGNSNNMESFIKAFEKIKQTAINYYKNKA